MSAAPSLAALSKKDYARLIALLTPKLSAFVPHVPTSRQHAALLLDDVQELLYGGAAGGGKSDWLLMEALKYVDAPSYAALLMRRTFAQLSKAGGLLTRAQEWLAGTAAHGTETVSGLPTKWLFPSGARIEFGHCQHEANRFDYQSAEYQFIGFDELTQFTERIYLYLMSRLRRLASSPVPLRVRSASNPGGIGHAWVRDRFVKLQTPAPDRAFLPAKLNDNPHLDRTEYAATLANLHPYERKQLLDGDWDVRPPGGRFKREWFTVVPELPSDVGRFVRYWDLAGTEEEAANDPDWTAGARLGMTPRRQFVMSDVQRFRKTPGAVKTCIRQTAELDGLGTRIVIEQEPGSSGKFVVHDFIKELAGFNVRGRRPTGDKFLRMDPLAAQAEAGNVLLVNGPWVEPFLQEGEMIDGSGKTHDDQWDASAGALQELRRGDRVVNVR